MHWPWSPGLIVSQIFEESVFTESSGNITLILSAEKRKEDSCLVCKNRAMCVGSRINATYAVWSNEGMLNQDRKNRILPQPHHQSISINRFTFSELQNPSMNISKRNKNSSLNEFWSPKIVLSSLSGSNTHPYYSDDERNSRNRILLHLKKEWKIVSNSPFKCSWEKQPLKINTYIHNINLIISIFCRKVKCKAIFRIAATNSAATSGPRARTLRTLGGWRSGPSEIGTEQASMR